MNDLPEFRATCLLEQYDVTAPPTPDGLVHLLSNRIKIIIHPMDEELPGMLVPKVMHDYIWLREQDGKERRRFSMWHEVGHYLMHPGSFYCFAKSTRQMLMEREANRFAAALLMPEVWIRQDVADRIDTAWKLAKRYQVSEAAMKWRIQELGLAGHTFSPRRLGDWRSS